MQDVAVRKRKENTFPQSMLNSSTMIGRTDLSSTSVKLSAWKGNEMAGLRTVSIMQ